MVTGYWLMVTNSTAVVIISNRSLLPTTDREEVPKCKTCEQTISSDVMCYSKFDQDGQWSLTRAFNYRV